MNRGINIFFAGIIILTVLGFYSFQWMLGNFSELPIYGEDVQEVIPFQLIDQNNDSFSLDDLSGKIIVANYFFTSCPSICPKMMRNMQDVHDILRSDTSILLLSLTVDPRRDQPKRLQQYSKKFNVNEETWKFLTGQKTMLYRLARRFFLVSATDGNGGKNDFIHSENIVVIDDKKKIRGIVDGTKPNAESDILDIISKLKS